MTLYQHLLNFRRPASEEALTAAFAGLAPHFIYGGYLQVGELYRIYIRTVEFYFHDERDIEGAVKDPIVYHRNGRIEGMNPPYFPLMCLHAHQSGMDITFENEGQQYRASALIREYSVFDMKAGGFLKLKQGKERDDRSTFLYDYVNGFSLSGCLSVKWVDDPHSPQNELLQGCRRNVFVYREGVKSRERDTRKWSFRLNDKDVWLPTI